MVGGGVSALGLILVLSRRRGVTGKGFAVALATFAGVSLQMSSIIK